MISTITYDGDGNNRVFPVSFTIKGEEYVKIFIDNVPVIDRTTYDIINNSIVFVVGEAPPVGTDNVVITVASSPTEVGDLDAPPSAVSTILDNLDNINIVAANVDLLKNTANGEYIVSELPATASIGDLALNIMDGKVYEYTETGWVVVATNAEGGGSGDGTAPIVPIDPVLPPYGTEGEFRYNTTDGQFYVYIDGEWKYITAPPTEGDIGIGVYSTNPTENLHEGMVIFNTTLNKLLKYSNGTWSQVVEPTTAAQEVANGSITTAKFASGITPVEIVDTLPTTDNFVGRMVLLTTDGKLYRYLSTGFTTAVATSNLTGTITSTQIADDAITTPKIATGAITADEISSNAITSDKITANAITTAKILAGAIGASQIAAGAITTDKLYAGAITAEKIATNAIDATKIVAGAISSDKLAANSVTAGAIVAGAISTYHLGAQVVTANQIAAGAITASKLSAGAISGQSITITSATNPTGGSGGVGSSLGWFSSSRDQVSVYGYNTYSSGTGVAGEGKTGGYFISTDGNACVADTYNSAGQWGFITYDKTYSGGGFSPFTGSHIVYSNEKLKVGQLVYSKDAWVHDIDNCLIHVGLTNTRNDKRVVGVVSYVNTTLIDNLEKNPLISINIGTTSTPNWVIKDEYKDYIDYMVKNNFKEIEINSLGEGGILVCSENGNIDNGDYLVSSTMKGYAMKQDDGLMYNYTVAKALESVDWSKESHTTKLIACTYHCG